MSSVSFGNVTAKWFPELKHFCPDVPFLLIGTKADQRNDTEELKKIKQTGLSIVTTEQAQELAQKLKAEKYMECSAKTQDNLKNVFDESIRAVLRAQEKKQKRICILL
jgi:GTPase SAR1 family protein